jgi:hypothetical protein
MLVIVTRTNKTQDGIFGNLIIDTNPFKCLTMERLSLAIPVGVFPIRWMRSIHFQQIMPFIVVPGRTACEQHWANWPNQLEGCQALGTSEELAKDMLVESKDAWNAYIDVILNEPNLMLKVIEDF